MEPWYKFILYGTYDGFSRSTLGDDNLYLVLENGEKVEIPRSFVKNASDFIEKDKLKLKDVIARIKKLDLGTQKVWLNEILNELGSDYGTLKYKDGYEQGKFDSAVERAGTIIPQIVADYIKYAKENGWDLLDAMKGISYDDCDDLRKWFYRDNNIEVFARTWFDGYTVEKKKRYLVQMKGMNKSSTILKLDEITGSWYLGEDAEYSYTKTAHTSKELEDAGFGWVFDCEGIELEEVEE